MTVTSQETSTSTLKNYVNGVWTDAAGAELHPVVNPATGEAIARVPYSTASHLDDAVKAARDALPVWRGQPPLSGVPPCVAAGTPSAVQKSSTDALGHW